MLVASGWFVLDRLPGFDGAAVVAGLRGLAPGQVLLALVAVATAFAAVAGQERAVVAHLGLGLPPGRAGQAAAAAQTVGFGPVVGALVRRRMLAEVTLAQSFAISAGITLGFFAGLGLLTLAAFAVLPGLPQRGAALGLLVLVLAGLVALSRWTVVPGLRRPNLFIPGRFLFWLALDLAALATALWVVLPSQMVLPFWHLVPVFLVALGLGIASGSPGGVGPFEATLLAMLPQVEAAGLVAGVLAFRVLAFALSGRALLRRKLAHASKAGVTVEDCATPPLAEMAAVAAEWQAAHGRERGFSMGRWQRTYAAGQRVIMARGSDGVLIAFVTFHAGRADWVLDLLRFRPGAPDGTIYAMINHALAMARWHEVREVSLASVPDATFGLTGPLGQLVRRATLGSVGLVQFKSAFTPRWRVLYVAAPSRLALVICGLEVARAILRPAPLVTGREALVVLDGLRRRQTRRRSAKASARLEPGTGSSGHDLVGAGWFLPETPVRGFGTVPCSLPTPAEEGNARPPGEHQSVERGGSWCKYSRRRGKLRRCGMPALGGAPLSAIALAIACRATGHCPARCALVTGQKKARIGFHQD